MKTLFTIAEAAAFTSKESKFPLSEDDVIDLAQQELLPICFAAEGELLQARIEHQGKAEEFNLPIPFNGILRAMSPPDSGENLNATLVEVVRVDRMRFAVRDGKKFGVQFPTEDSHVGRIKFGYRVVAYVDFIDVPKGQWRFHIDDLLHILERQVSAQPEAQPTSPEKKERGIGVPYKYLIDCFNLAQTKWSEILRRKNRRRTYEAALCAPGTRKREGSATFNPAIFGALLIKNQVCGYSITRVDAIIEKHFKSYRDAWSAERQELE